MAQASLKSTILARPEVAQLRRVFEGSGYHLRIVGGAVRDILLERQPKDLDLATDALPETIKALLEQHGIKAVLTGVEHGTVTAVINKEHFEITTLKLESTARTGNPWQQDAEKRDLTVNAMSMSLDGTVHDFFGGQEDIAHRRLRFVKSAAKRVDEDPLRILRYYRFHGQIACPGNHEASTLETIRQFAPRLQQVSGERIWQEMGKLLQNDTALDLLLSMRDCHVLEHIGLEVTQAMLDRFGNVARNARNPVTRLASLLNNAADCERIAAHWHLSNAEKKHCLFLISHRDRSFSFEAAQDMLVDGHLRLHVLELLRTLGMPDFAHQLEHWQPPAFPVTGKDLKALGVAPGKTMGQLLGQLKTAWKDSRYTLSRATLLDMVPSLAHSGHT